MNKVKVENRQVFILELTEQEAGALYGLLCSVNEHKSECDISQVRKTLGDLYDDDYLTQDYIPHFGEGYDGIEIYQD